MVVHFDKLEMVAFTKLINGGHNIGMSYKIDPATNVFHLMNLSQMKFLVEVTVFDFKACRCEYATDLLSDLVNLL